LHRSKVLLALPEMKCPAIGSAAGDIAERTTMQQPLISVVMANYCGANYLPAALDAVLSQTVGDIEIIVSDDASSDESAAIVRSFANRDPRVTLIVSNRNRGPAAARNRALEAARGKWIAIVDSDDIIHPDRFAILLAAAEELHADAVADDLQFFSDGGEGTTLLGKHAPSEPQSVSAGFFIRSNTQGEGLPPLGYLKPIFRRTALAGKAYDEQARVGEDYDFLLRFLLDGGRLFLLPERLYFYRRHAASISHRLSEAKVLGMIASQERLLAGHAALPDEIVRLLDRRMRRLRRALSFERLVASLKERQAARAFGLLAADPRLCLQLGKSALAHFASRGLWPRRGPPEASHAR
jgi:succinoglycan biosynthesis protein ExoO